MRTIGSQLAGILRTGELHAQSVARQLPGDAKAQALARPNNSCEGQPRVNPTMPTYPNESRGRGALQPLHAPNAGPVVPLAKAAVGAVSQPAQVFGGREECSCIHRESAKYR